MTDREILDQLEQWLEIWRDATVVTTDSESSFVGQHQAYVATLDRLRELRALANWLTERATTTSPSRPVDELLDELETDDE